MSESPPPPSALQDGAAGGPPSEPPTGSAHAALRALRDAVAALESADPIRSSVAELGDDLAELEQLLDAASGVAARWAEAFAAQGGPEDAGAPTLAAWMRRELRLTARESRRRTKAATALHLLPSSRAEFHAGKINRQHVDAIADGVHELGARVMADFEHVVLDVARECDADAVRMAIRRIRDTLDPDAADAAYVHALERRDVTVTKAGEGYVLGGFLPPETGAMFQQVLYAAAKPDGPDDDRSPGQRRVDGLDAFCRALLDHGLPTDRGLRPQLYVTVSADRLEAVQRGTDAIGTMPAELAGFGPIGDALLSRLACDCDVTPVTVDDRGEAPRVLDVGRTSRLATLKQRRAIQIQQGGTCANPGCDRTHLEIHHRIPWSLGGRTDLDQLAGYCTRCHHLIHRGLLIIEPDGDGRWTHRTRRARRLVDRQRRSLRSTTRFTRHVLIGGVAYARQHDEQRRTVVPGQRPRPDPD